MKALFLVGKGDPNKVFEIKEVEKPKVEAGEVLIKVAHFGLNYADVFSAIRKSTLIDLLFLVSLDMK